MIHLFTRLAQVFGGIGLLSLILLLATDSYSTYREPIVPVIIIGAFLCLFFSFCALLGAIIYRDSAYRLTSGFLLVCSSIPVLISLALPFVCNVREPAKHMQNMNNIIELSVAMSFYAKKYNQLPDHKTDGHSWRVYLLPYIECKDLFDKIRLDEPRDSPWNRQFHNQMPTVFRSPLYEYKSDNEKKSLTTYCLIVGGESPYPANGNGPKKELIDSMNKSSDVIMIAESQPGCWMDPNFDIPFEEAVKGVNLSPCGLWSYAKNRMIAVGLYSSDGYSSRFYFPKEYSDLSGLRAMLSAPEGTDDRGL